MIDLSHYSSLSEMFSYPSAGLKENTAAWRKIVQNYDPGLAVCLDPFIYHVENETTERLQEYFVSTFYVQPLCCLDIGYVLFGEDYRRGQFMANLRMEHRMAGNDCGTELPDHFPVLLRLLPKIKDPSFTGELAFSLMIPAVKEMISGFKGDKNHYKGLLRIVAVIMEKDFPGSGYERFQFNRKTVKTKTAGEESMPSQELSYIKQIPE